MNFLLTIIMGKKKSDKSYPTNEVVTIFFDIYDYYLNEPNS